MVRSPAKNRSRSQKNPDGSDQWVSLLASKEPIGGIPGPGHWLVIEYRPTALFSLKNSMATSSVGKTLVIPTPYAIKMAFVDAAFRAGHTDADCGALLEALVGVTVRIAPPTAAIVTHTFVKVRQESRGDDPLRPYGPGIAYREVAHFSGSWHWAFDLASGNVWLAEYLVLLASHVNYVGKRGSFIQYMETRRLTDLGMGFTQPLDKAPEFILPERAHIVPLDDFGPEASLNALSSYSSESAKRERHRKFTDTIVPLGVVNSGPGFTEYASRR